MTDQDESIHQPSKHEDIFSNVIRKLGYVVHRHCHKQYEHAYTYLTIHFVLEHIENQVIEVGRPRYE